MKKSFGRQSSFWVALSGALLLFPIGTFVAIADTGSANVSLNLIVPIVTTVACTSTPVTAPAGSQTNTLNVTCTLTGNPNNLATGNVNSFTYPSTISSSGHTLNVTPVSSVTSPDTSVTSISGTYAGFVGTLSAGNTWKVQSSCQVPTTATTPAGTYTGTVTYNYSTL